VTDLVLAVMKSVNWHDVDCFIISLRRTGYTGRVVFFVENITEEARTKLKEFGVELVDFTTPAAALSVHFQTARYIPGAAFLQEHYQEFRYVMWTDVWDVVFQSNPFEWIEANIKDKKIIAAKEGWFIKNQAINDIWIRKLVNDEEYNRLREEEVLCAGTIFGVSSSMKDLISAIANQVLTVDGMMGLDQGMVNVFLRREPFKGITWVPDPSAGFICTCGPFLAPSDPQAWTIAPPVFDRATGLVYTENGTLFSVVHQYNRHNGPLDPDGAWTGILQSRYR
jgi:hypothetical protein